VVDCSLSPSLFLFLCVFYWIPVFFFLLLFLCFLSVRCLSCAVFCSYPSAFTPLPSPQVKAASVYFYTRGAVVEGGEDWERWEREEGGGEEVVA
jgi:hypothetical protein